MDRLAFSDYEDFIYEINDKFSLLTDKFDDISIIAKYEDAKEIIRKFAILEYEMVSVDIHRPEWNDYTDEYLISLNFDGIWCEPMKHDDNYIDDESAITYILDNCSSKVINHCKSEKIYEVCIGEDEADETDQDIECVCKEYDKNNCPSSTVKTEYRINDKVVDKDTYEKELSKIVDSWTNIRNELFELLFRW